MITRLSQCRTGMRVRCSIERTEIDDAMLHVDGCSVYICQNLKC